MPCLQLATNVPVDQALLSDLLKDLSKAACAQTGKPEKYMMIVVRGSVPLLMSGTEEPAAMGTFSSIGAIGGEKNPKITKAFADILEAKLGVKPDRFYLNFQDVHKNDWGWNSTTFATYI